MKLLAEISDATIGIHGSPAQDEKPIERKSARAILLNEEGRMAVQYLNTYRFHKLPGGGIEEGETHEEALIREIREEVGCNAEILASVGMVIERRTLTYALTQTSYCFVARVVGPMGIPQLEDAEIAEGQETVWLQPEVALSRIKSDAPLKQEGLFIQKRETSFLEEYLRTNRTA